MANWRADQSEFVLEYIELTKMEKQRYNLNRIDEFEIE